MSQEQEQAKASEPVDVAKDEQFMDTGVLHEKPQKPAQTGNPPKQAEE